MIEPVYPLCHLAEHAGRHSEHERQVPWLEFGGDKGRNAACFGGFCQFCPVFFAHLFEQGGPLANEHHVGAGGDRLFELGLLGFVRFEKDQIGGGDQGGKSLRDGVEARIVKVDRADDVDVLPPFLRAPVIALCKGHIGQSRVQFGVLLRAEGQPLVGAVAGRKDRRRPKQAKGESGKHGYAHVRGLWLRDRLILSGVGRHLNEV